MRIIVGALIALVERLNKLVVAQHLAQCLIHSKNPVSTTERILSSGFIIQAMTSGDFLPSLSHTNTPKVACYVITV